MSPLALRRNRAERLLERDFHALRSRVLAVVAARLRSAGATLDGADLEACYASAWQGLYAATLRGEQIANPGGWLALVTYRRAIEELRARRRSEGEPAVEPAVDPDVDAALDDRARLRQLFEGMRSRLDLREREAAALCYLHGYSRAEAARIMGISELRMRKLMDGGGAGRAGVAQKISSLARTIDAGRFCGEQDSLMRAFAFGVLDPGGERHRIAAAHVRACPACRRRVASLRGLAVSLPPVLTLPGAGNLGLVAIATGTAHGSAGAVGAAGTGPPLGFSAAGGGAAGSGWAIGGGGLVAKLAAGCAIVAGVGAGCVALDRAGGRRSDGHLAPRPAAVAPAPGAADAPAVSTLPASPAMRKRSQAAGEPAPGSAGAPNREFTPEQPPAEAPDARAVPSAATAAGVEEAPPPARPGGASPAEREFGAG